MYMDVPSLSAKVDMMMKCIAKATPNRVIVLERNCAIFVFFDLFFAPGILQQM